VKQLVEPIMAIYVQEDDDWTITVSGLGKSLTARAPGIIAARDRTDQLVEKLTPEGRPTVVHLLNGSAVEFTATYMTARLTRPQMPPLEVPPSPASTKQEQPEAVVPDKPAPKPPLPQGKRLPKAVEPRKPGSRSKKNEPGSAVSAAKAATPPAAAR
jgi:hypothetical protein